MPDHVIDQHPSPAAPSSAAPSSGSGRREPAGEALVVDLYVPSSSYGLTHDADVLQVALEARAGGPPLRVRRVPVPPAVFQGEQPMTFPERLGRPGQLAIFIERVFEAAYLDAYRHRALLVNPEWLDPLSAAASERWIDTLLHKSRVSQRLLESAFPRQAHVYTGFTSKDPGLRVQDYRAFSHFRGRSRRRMTREILALWRQHPALPMLWLQARGQDIRHATSDWVGEGNVCRFSGWLAPEAYFPALARGGIQLCTSQVEGFGHYINEARAMAALVITLDAPPMNELITPETGILLPAVPGGGQHRGAWYQATAEALRRAVDQALQLPEADREALGVRARRAFDDDRQAFRRRLARALDTMMQENACAN